MEEFFNLINRYEERDARYEKLYNIFSSKLPSALTEVVFKHLPKFSEQREKFEPKVFETSEKYVAKIWEEFNYSCSCKTAKEKKESLALKRKPQTRDDAEKELQEKLSQFLQNPELASKRDELEKRYTRIFWESYEEEYAKMAYEYAVYEKMKEVFTSVYIDDLLELDSHNLRSFDSGIYFTCSCDFIQEIYKL